MFLHRTYAQIALDFKALVCAFTLMVRDSGNVDKCNLYYIGAKGAGGGGGGGGL